MPFSIGQAAGPYRIVEKLGQGGMATVFKAYHATLDRYVAIKVLHPAFREDPNFLARFQREARIVAKLDHPNIVPVYDFAEHENHPYLVMRFVEGETLKGHLKQNPSTLELTRQITEAVGSALAYAHDQNVLHRDIKPSNIMLSQEDHVFLTDFGLARMAEAGESTLSRDMMVGTPQYISPEQAKGEMNLDARTDIYSLGVVLYELLVGRVPFQADTPYAIVHDHIFTPLPLPRSLRPNLPEPMERLLLKALAKDPNDRFQSIDEMLEIFRAVLGISPDDVLPKTMVIPPSDIDAFLADSRHDATRPITPITERDPQTQQGLSLVEEETVLTTRVLVSKVDATRIVQKSLEGTLRKREQIKEDAPKVLMPLWRVHAKVRKGRLAKQETDKYLYYDAHYGKLLTLEAKALRLTDIVGIKAHQIADLDTSTQFKEVPRDQLTSVQYSPRVSKRAIMETAREMFGIQIIDAQIVLFPLWQFTVLHRESGQAKQVLVDTTFGRVVEGRLYLIEDAQEPPSMPDPF